MNLKPVSVIVRNEKEINLLLALLKDTVDAEAVAKYPDGRMAIQLTPREIPRDRF